MKLSYLGWLRFPIIFQLRSGIGAMRQSSLFGHLIGDGANLSAPHSIIKFLSAGHLTYITDNPLRVGNRQTA